MSKWILTRRRDFGFSEVILGRKHRLRVGSYLLFFRNMDFDKLVSIIRPYVQKHAMWRKDFISAEMRLGITIRFLGTDDLYTM